MLDEQQRAREELIQKIQVGRDEIERGEGIEIDEGSLEQFFADINTEVQRELDEPAGNPNEVGRCRAQSS